MKGLSKAEASDVLFLIGVIIAYGLPMTLLLPNFSVWEVIPKMHVERFPIVGQQLPWRQLNAAIVALLVIFFCLFLEIRKRKFDEMLEQVLKVSQATEAAMDIERERRSVAFRVCVELLDASADHYENLALLRSDLNKIEMKNKQFPPAVELSSCPLYT